MTIAFSIDLSDKRDVCLSALACCACFAESMTPLIFAGPPFMFDTADDVGVFGEGFDKVGDLGSCLVAILVGRGLTGCAVLVVCRRVVGAGPGLLPSAGFIFLTISPALEVSLSLAGDLGNLWRARGDERPPSRLSTWGEILGGFEGVFDSKADPFSIFPKPPSLVPLLEGAFLGTLTVSLPAPDSARAGCFLSK